MERQFGSITRHAIAIGVFATATGLACDDSAPPVEHADAQTSTQPTGDNSARGDPGGSEAGAAGENSAGTDAPSVHLSPEARDRIEITVESVRSGRLEGAIEAPATIEYPDGRVAHVSPLVEGQITEVHVSVGETVEADQVVATMRSAARASPRAALGDARAAVEEAKVAREVARKHFERHQTLRERGIVSDRAFIEARGSLDEARATYEAAQARLESLGVPEGEGPRYPLRSGISGTVISRSAARGETNGPGDQLFVVADRSEVWLVGQVYESDIHRAQTGMKAVATVEAYPAKSWEGTVDWIGERLEGDSRVLPVRVVLDNTEGLLRPGMYGELRLMPSDVADPVPLVPVDAVQRIGGRQVVFVPGKADGGYRLREVETGAESAGLVEIRDGLGGIDAIVTTGAFELKTARRSN